MKRVILEQGSQEWLEWRRSRLMASDMKELMGSDAAIDKLWKKKTEGLEEYQTDRMRWGKHLEPEVRAMFNSMLGTYLAPQVIVRDDNDRFGASLDGLSECGTIACEIKCTSSFDRHEVVRANLVLDIHVHQLQWQLYVSGLQEIFYVSYCPEHPHPLEYFLVKRDENLIKEMEKEARGFLECLDAGKCPVAVNHVNDPIKLEKSKRLEAILPLYKELEREVEELRNDLKEGLPESKTVIGNVFLSPVWAQGRVKYNLIPELIGKNLEEYRGKPSVRWTVSISA